MSIRFIWDDSYSVDRKDIDNQHKRMFDLANGLPEDLGQRRIMETIMDLYKYTREHFEAEEQMMKEIGYPKIEEHTTLHEELILGLNAMAAKAFDDDQSVFAFKKFIYDWVIDHILNHDRDYFRFAKGQQLAH
jgi:hemerythrin